MSVYLFIYVERYLWSEREERDTRGHLGAQDLGSSPFDGISPFQAVETVDRQTDHYLSRVSLNLLLANQNSFGQLQDHLKWRVLIG